MKLLLKHRSIEHTTIKKELLLWLMGLPNHIKNRIQVTMEDNHEISKKQYDGGYKR